MKRTRLYLPWSLLAGLLALAVAAQSLKATSLVLNKLKQGQTTSTTSSEAPPAGGEGEMDGETGEDSNSTSPTSHLTGIPQKDYVHDPNLPRELNGFNLTTYPFYDRVPDPEEMDFKCDGLHDGFYASVEHKCQVYHHCLFGTRYDFLCANYTAFDQKTFICHFASEVDCVNSPKYFKRNEALYKADSTTTSSTAAPPPPPLPPAHHPQQQGGRRKRPQQRPRRPVYDYYYDDDYEDEQEYYDDDVSAAPPSGKGGPRRTRKHPRRPVEDSLVEDSAPGDPKSLYERPRVPPKVRRPVPLAERDKYGYNTRPTLAPPPSTSPADEPRSKHPPDAAPEDDYYDDEEEYAAPARSRPRDIVRRPPMSGAGRPIRRRPTGGRRRPSVDATTPYTPPYEDEYDYDFEDEPRRPARPNRKRQRQPARQDQYGGQRNSGRYEAEEEVVDPVPAPRPAYISPAGSRPGFRKRTQQPQDEYRAPKPSTPGSYKRPTISRKQVPSRYADESDDDYYDDEVPEDEPAYRRPRPSSSNSRSSYKQDEAPARAQTSNKRPLTSPGRAGNNSPSRLSQNSPSKNIPPTASDNLQDIPPPPPKVQPTLPPLRPKPEPELPGPPRTAFRSKTSSAAPPRVEEEFDDEEELEDEEPSQRSSNFRKPSNGDEDRPASNKNNEYQTKEVVEDLPPRVPPSSYGSFRTKLSQSDRDATSRTGNSKSRPNNSDMEQARPKVESDPIPPSAPAKDLYDAAPLSRPGNPRPVKVFVKPIDRNPPHIPDDIPDRQNLADVGDHDEYDITLNDALHPTLHPTRSIPSGFVLPQRPDRPKAKANYVTRAANYQPLDEPTTASGRGSVSYLEGSASQTYVTRTAFPLHDKYDSSTDASYRGRRPVPQYEEAQSSQVRYRQPEEVSQYQQRPSWSRREPSGDYYTN